MDTQAQMQAIVDKLSGAGKEPLPLAALDKPWRTIYHRVARAGDFTEAEMMLYRATRDVRPTGVPPGEGRKLAAKCRRRSRLRDLCGGGPRADQHAAPRRHLHRLPLPGGDEAELCRRPLARNGRVASGHPCLPPVLPQDLAGQVLRNPAPTTVSVCLRRAGAQTQDISICPATHSTLLNSQTVKQ